MKYREDAWENKNLDELYECVGWTPNRMNLINYILEVNPESLLEVACLDGCYIRKLREMDFKGDYVGIDITNSHIEKAVYRTSPKEDFRIGDARNLEFEDNSFDMVTVSDVIQHLPSAKVPLSEACRVARNYVFVSIYGTHNETFTHHRKKNLNTSYNKEHFLKFIPDGWHPVQFEEFDLPSKGKTRPLFHFKLEPL